MVAALYREFTAQDILDTDQREFDYCRGEVDPGALRMLDGSAVPVPGQIWIYISKPEAVDPPDADYPIVQSYVDIFITGCLQLAERVVGQNEDFAEQCITTTSGWSPHWVIASCRGGPSSISQMQLKSTGSCSRTSQMRSG